MAHCSIRSTCMGVALGVLAGVITTSPAVAQDPTPTPDPDNPFGVIEAYDAPEAASRLGASWTRAKFHWGLIQPDSADQWIEPDLSDAELAAELSAGREVVGLLIGLPEWAQDPVGLPDGLYTDINDPSNVWAAFVRTVVGRYRGQIDHWIVWNEPDIWDAQHPAFTWPGTERDFARLMEVSYLTAHKVNPDVVIHLAAFTHWWDALYGRELYFERLMRVLASYPGASEHGYFYDIATMHVYFTATSPYDLLEQYRAIQESYGIEKPFWLVETNAAPSTDPVRPVEAPTFDISMLEQAAYMPQAFALARAAGAQRVGVFKMVDTPGDLLANPEPFGLVRADGTLRPVFRTTQVAINQLAGSAEVLWTERGAVSQVLVMHANEVTRIIWNRLPEPTSVEVPALGAEAQLVDMWGNMKVLVASGGRYTLALPAGECQETIEDYCMIGGPPIYLVEGAPAKPDGLWLEVAPYERPSQPVRLSPVAWGLWGAAAVCLTLAGGAGGWLLAAGRSRQ